MIDSYCSHYVNCVGYVHYDILMLAILDAACECGMKNSCNVIPLIN